MTDALCCTVEVVYVDGPQGADLAQAQLQAIAEILASHGHRHAPPSPTGEQQPGPRRRPARSRGSRPAPAPPGRLAAPPRGDRQDSQPDRMTAPRRPAGVR
jgi:hypothetical protein